MKTAATLVAIDFGSENEFGSARFKCANGNTLSLDGLLVEQVHEFGARYYVKDGLVVTIGEGSSGVRGGVLNTMAHSVSVLHHMADEGVAERRYADELHLAKESVAEVIAACEPFTRHNSSEETFVAPHLKKQDVDRLRSALATAWGIA